MKILKTLDVEGVNEKMAEIDEILEEQDAVLLSDDEGPSDCLAQVASKVYGEYGYTKEIYSSASLEGRIDYFYDPTGSSSGYTPMRSDIPEILKTWFDGGSIYLSKNYQEKAGRYVIIVLKYTDREGKIRGHAVQLMSVSSDGKILVWDPQRTCPDYIDLSHVSLAYETTGAKRLR